MLFRRRNGSSKEALDENAILGGRLSHGRSGGGTVIGAGTRVTGTIKGDGPVLVHGTVLGGIDIRGGLTVTSTGRVDADVDVASARVSGEARGSIRASDRVVLAATGLFEGLMATPIIEMHPGSVLRGRATVAGVALPPRRALAH